MRIISVAYSRGRRRFISDYMGRSPLISDAEHTTRLPMDVDEDVFTPACTTVPLPRSPLSLSEPNSSDFKYFGLKCRYVYLVQSCSPPCSLHTQVSHNWSRISKDVPSGTPYRMILPHTSNSRWSKRPRARTKLSSGSRIYRPHSGWISTLTLGLRRSLTWMEIGRHPLTLAIPATCLLCSWRNDANWRSRFKG